MVRRPLYGFYWWELTGALVYLCLEDLRINNFTFHGFPELYSVSEPVSGKTNDFVLELRARGQRAEFTLNIQSARKIAKEYKKRRAVKNNEVMDTVQQALINLEVAVGRSR